MARRARPSPVWCRPGRWAGWVYRGSTTQPPARGEQALYSEAGPGSSCRELEWVVQGAAGVLLGRRRGRPCTHPAGPVAHPWAPWCRTSQIAALQPIRARLRSYSCNVSQTAKCHQKVSKRPVLVPISKTVSKSHLLDFSDFSFC